LSVEQWPSHVEERPHAEQVSERQEREAVRGLEGQGDVQGASCQIANSPNASKNGGKKSGSGGSSKQGGTTAQHKAAGRKGGKAAAKKS
jgi:hypothetical protein